MTGILHVFPDTNVFLQCKPLNNIDWSSLGDWSEVEVIVCAPVQEELDALKGKGNGRQASRARSANAFLGGLLEPGVDHLTVCRRPIVRVSVRMELTPDDVASRQLTSTQDSVLVATALAFQRAHPDATARILTNDNGPLFIAKRLGVDYLRVPAEWLLPPEPDEADKRIEQLKQRVAQLEKSEPAFEAIVTDSNGREFRSVDGTVPSHVPLDEGQVATLVARLVTRFPRVTDFGPARVERPRQESARPHDLSFGLGNDVFVPPTDKRISDYDAEYRAWRSACEEQLAGLHKALDGLIRWPLVKASIRNVGSRPAQDALVAIEVSGTLWVTPLAEGSKNQIMQLDREPAVISLPRPPTAPEGSWQRSSALGFEPRFLASLENASLKSLLDSRGAADLLLPNAHDPDRFYWKTGRRGLPGRCMELTCQRWRHAQRPKDFTQTLACPATVGVHAGLLTVTVHAANLTQPHVVSLPVRITRKAQDCLSRAEELVQELVTVAGGG